MAMPTGVENRNNCSGKGQQQFNRLIDRPFFPELFVLIFC
jgi:hypothetical protein